MFKNVDVVVDLQFGSTGKGALSGYLSRAHNYEMVISANMPNAGHTAYCPDTDQKFIHKVLPSGLFSRNLKYIGVAAGSAFFIDRLEEEWAAVCKWNEDKPGFTLVIHEAAAIVTQEHKNAEMGSLNAIASTMQGSAEALIDKIRRQSGAIAKHHSEELLQRLSKYGDVKIVNQSQWLRYMCESGSILVEGSQGYSLSISAGFYPYCTSRDCTPARVMADAGVPIGWLCHVYGSARVHPIRVGNTPEGYSGDWYADQQEISFEQLGVVPERTTVTQRIRRVATFSEEQILEAMAMACPDAIFLNFAQYDIRATKEAERIINNAAEVLDCGGVTLFGFGPRPAEIKDINEND